jgi:hypothetical protein
MTVSYRVFYKCEKCGLEHLDPIIYESVGLDDDTDNFRPKLTWWDCPNCHGKGVYSVAERHYPITSGR